MTAFDGPNSGVMNLQAYEDRVFELLRARGFDAQGIRNRLTHDPILPHCYMKGRDPVRVAAALASKWKRWHQS